MENKVETLKDVRRQIREMNATDEDFIQHFKSLSTDALNCMEGVNDMQEKNWIQKGREIVSDLEGDASNEQERDRDRALSYLKEAVHSVILREDNYGE